MTVQFSESIQDMINYENKITIMKRDHRLSIVDFIILEEIYRTEEITIKEILQGKMTELLTRPSNIGTNLAKLYRKGYIGKYRSDLDERKVYYYMEENQKVNYKEMINNILL